MPNLDRTFMQAYLSKFAVPALFLRVHNQWIARKNV